MAEQIRASGIPREELFVTSKLPWVYHYLYARAVSESVFSPRFHHCDRVKEFFEDSLEALGLDYIDLVSPIPSSPYLSGR